MRPAPEALAQTIDVMLERTGTPRNEELALELESRIIVSQTSTLIGYILIAGCDLPTFIPRHVHLTRPQCRSSHSSDDPRSSERIVNRLIPQSTG